MHVYSTLITLALGLDAALSQPHDHHARHPNMKKRDDSEYYNKREAYRDVPVVAQPQPPVVTQQSTTQGQGNPGAGGSGYKSPGGPKRGLCYNNFESPQSLSMFQGAIGKTISWGWDWASVPFQLPSGLSFYPNIRTTQGGDTANWATNVQKAISGGSGYILGFNEPDVPEQANMPPGDAAGQWGSYMQQFAGKSGVYLGSPAVTSAVQGTKNAAGQPMGLDWLGQFLSSCSSCQVDFIVLHFYGCPNGACGVDADIAALQTFVTRAKQFANGKKIWLTEVGTYCADKAGFIRKAIAMLDNDPAIDRWAYFMVKEGDLISGGALSPAGTAYIS